MANTVIKGIQPYDVMGGGPVTYRRERVLTNNTTAIFLYDTVIQVATGDVTVTAVGTTLISSVQGNGAYYKDAAGVYRGGKFLPAATLYSTSGIQPADASYVYVVDNVVNTRFRASVDAAIALTDLNLNYAITLGTGSTTTGLSGHLLTATGRAVTATIPIRAWLFEDTVLSDQSLANASVICSINAGQKEPALSASAGT